MPPTVKTQERIEIIIASLADGVPLRQICREIGIDYSVVYDWCKKDADLSQRIAQARSDGADAIADESLQIVDAVPERGADGKIDPASVQWQKLRAEHRLKLLAKWHPKKYGDKIAVGGDDTAPPIAHTHEVDFSAARVVAMAVLADKSGK